MFQKTVIWTVVAIVLILILISNKGETMLATIKNLLEKFEGYSPRPYYDVSRWSWGYGTEAPKGAASGTITRAQAMNEAMTEVDSIHSYLKPMVTIPLTPAQWAALISFGYNLGKGSAAKLVPNINSGNKTALRVQWLSYNNVRKNGTLTPDDGLTSRRNYEWRLFNV